MERANWPADLTPEITHNHNGCVKLDDWTSGNQNFIVDFVTAAAAFAVTENSESIEADIRLKSPGKSV